ncbi:tRNA lysidine(34) synthetase TilS [Catonella massiliensis]|uniref:tRNA(Ile)-lysidine synthase n=1 Tax=Catonella massiliensis TaxID=2799636 RepID=A0ABS1J2H6_9FIRM|nr:tRNA lysidine(34) synthetase TilS [Catonella massiliensis]MBK5898348.1 tRNA lysidine(34) synthetase TilS [Catonella massiliensis]
MDSIDKIKAVIKDNELIKEGERVVVGVSGGADSVCLLLVLKEIMPLECITAVHINHGIRGDEAARDEDFVLQLCKRQDIRLEIRRLDVPLFARDNKVSEEEAGRILRYRVFEEIRLLYKADKIAVAHNLNDVAETFLMNLSRGSGITGLTGIKLRSGVLIRPLIKTSRTEIEEIVTYLGEGFITDSTNNSLIYTRNRIRKRVIPELEEVNERAVSHINDACERLEKIEGYIIKEAANAYKSYVTKGKDIFISNEILTLDEVIIEEVLHKALSEAAGRARDIGGVHISYLLELFSKQVGREIDLPYQVRAFREYKGIRLKGSANKSESGESTQVLPELLLHTEDVEGISTVASEEDNIRLTFEDGSVKNLSQNSCIRWFDYDKIAENVMVRFKEEGDFLVISPEGDKKKLKKYFADSKIPSDKRGEIPLVASGNEVLWVVGYRTGEGARITQSTKKLLKMEIKRK